ncbi:MAG: LamG-like jellyroll fold domain-containing protein, partial [Candidatus Bathyarchaeia archaeon]
MKDKQKLTLALILTCILIETILAYDIVRGSSETLALWHMDEIYTSEASGKDTFAILGGNPPPTLVEGKFGKALSFDGENFLYVQMTPSLYAPEEVTLEAWIYINSFKDVEYNNIIAIAYRAGLEWQSVTRICGIALKPSQHPGKGFLRGYVYTDREHFNEIMTTEPLIPSNKWIHVAFTRSLSTGMHLYVDGKEVDVKVTQGVRNPRGNIIMGTEIFFGHDAEIIIDEPRMCDVALDPSQLLLKGTLELAVSRTEIDIGSNMLLAIT